MRIISIVGPEFDKAEAMAAAASDLCRGLYRLSAVQLPRGDWSVWAQRVDNALLRHGEVRQLRAWLEGAAAMWSALAEARV